MALDLEKEGGGTPPAAWTKAGWEEYNEKLWWDPAAREPPKYTKWRERGTSSSSTPVKTTERQERAPWRCEDPGEPLHGTRRWAGDLKHPDGGEWEWYSTITREWCKDGSWGDAEWRKAAECC
jgi:hypothetical protein